ncbi:beta-glucuronosyltransferase GlcAT14C-like [Salvia miltiorrhiza]|uniref:beta-glucuronosyltransferase GlcAT14C-like n=1 Tax=Salvia miltiorrhiza TaxID=226208 RepID=UPI0025AC366E|nr:beta-glucuronosyltransferase GlcAT14C-like [Salvia miltiorrhiza]XP_057769782.1 beta-glucuronosyltransferase GlcAT14C-like [Salvia miltiorrhiza]
MKMNKLKLLPMIPCSNKSCFLSSVVALMVLVVTLSHLCDQTKRLSSKYTTISHTHLQPRRAPSKGPNAPPILAYWILGTKGENRRMMRLLKAIYHPRNHYLLQLDSSASHHERLELSIWAHSEMVFEQFGNVDVVGKSYAVNPMAASGLAAVLHAAALILRLREDWDWFVPLSTSDYPILPQDDILYAFSSLPKDVIFMGYNNATSFQKRQSARQIVVDPSLYLTKKASIFYAVETREKPDAFEIFGGSPWMVLTRGFLEHCVNGLDNLPRKLLMYFNNVVFPLQSYFQTVLCNTPHFQNNILVNNDLRHTEAHLSHTHPSPAAIFATPFRKDDPRMQEIDEKLLNRGRGKFVPGKWCNQTGLVNHTSAVRSGQYLCSIWGDIDAVQPSVKGIELKDFFLRGVGEKNMASSQCTSYVMHEATKI